MLNTQQTSAIAACIAKTEEVVREQRQMLTDSALRKYEETLRYAEEGLEIIERNAIESQEDSIRIVVAIDQKKAAAQGYPARHSTAVIFVRPQELEPEMRDKFAKAWDPKTGRVIIGDGPLAKWLSLISTGHDWKEAFRAQVSGH
jgi:hypothetical protein